MKTQRDLTGIKFGRLTVKHQEAKTVQKGLGRFWVCRCDCGKQISVYRGNLLSGNTTSCGCSKSKHGMAGTKIHGVWRSMRQRCENPNDVSYANYGGRGIKVCDRWQSFDSFFKDMGYPPKGGTLERIDNEGKYEPKNCRWASWKAQHNNKRTSRMLTAFGKTQTLAQWADEYLVSPLTLTSRLDRGKWSIEDALLLDRRKGRKPKS
jgi:hypothetical protein